MAWQVLVTGKSQSLKPAMAPIEKRCETYNPEEGIFMAHNAERKHYDEPFKQAAVDFLQKSGKTIDEVATELNLSALDLKHWRKKYCAGAIQKSGKASSNVAQLKAENEALRSEVLHLKVQWDILKTTLGVLSTTIGSRENYV